VTKSGNITTSLKAIDTLKKEGSVTTMNYISDENWKQFYDNKKYKNALKILKRINPAMKEGLASPYFFYLHETGMCLYWLKNYGKAITYLDEAASLEPRNIDYKNDCGNAREALKQENIKKKHRNKVIFKVAAVSAVALVVVVGIISLINKISSREKPVAEVVAEQTTALTAIVIAEGINFRSGPSTSSDIINVLHKGDTVIVIGDPASNAWMSVEHDGNRGYVSAEYLSISSGEQTAPAAPENPPAPAAPEKKPAQSDKSASSATTESVRKNIGGIFTGIFAKIHMLSLLSIPFAIIGIIICSKKWRSYKSSRITKIVAFCIYCLLIAFVVLRVFPVIKPLLIRLFIA
jgi:hypothetical protein